MLIVMVSPILRFTGIFEGDVWVVPSSVAHVYAVAPATDGANTLNNAANPANLGLRLRGMRISCFSGISDIMEKLDFAAGLPGASRERRTTWQSEHIIEVSDAAMRMRRTGLRQFLLVFPQSHRPTHFKSFEAGRGIPRLGEGGNPVPFKLNGV